ncbi:MAG: hypothetical protein K2F63_06760 [Muribaculaceae bacterium]|nr:hypothetical protein [Muribaculaceae bacterium]
MAKSDEIGDNPVLVHPFITRLSDGKTFVGDETGHYTLKAEKSDALAFSYAGTEKTDCPNIKNCVQLFYK